MERWILQTFFYWHGTEERGFNREFDSKQAAEEYVRNHACGDRYTITAVNALEAF